MDPAAYPKDQHPHRQTERPEECTCDLCREDFTVPSTERAGDLNETSGPGGPERTLPKSDHDRGRELRLTGRPLADLPTISLHEKRDLGTLEFGWYSVDVDETPDPSILDARDYQRIAAAPKGGEG